MQRSLQSFSSFRAGLLQASSTGSGQQYMPQTHTDPLIDFKLPLSGPLRAMLQPMVEKLLCIPDINDLYDIVGRRPDSDFLTDLLDQMGINVEVNENELATIPKEGPAVVVANHPFGGIEGVVLLQVLRRIRPDVKVMANYMLSMIPEMREHMITVDPFGGKDSQKRNIGPLKEAIRWAKKGNLLAVFPAGEVSSFQFKKFAVTDPEWNKAVGRIIRIAKAPVSPVFFHGTNGPLFQSLGLVHPRLRTVLLPREMMNKKNGPIRLSIGKPIPKSKQDRFDDDERLINYLRLRTYVLKHRDIELPPVPAELENAQPVAEACDADVLEQEIKNLPEGSVLLEQGDNLVFCAQGRFLPSILQEIGRLREISFREVGEGTGTPRDLDRFDDYYHHLVLWSKEAKEIIGAYRLGQADVIADAFGPQGLYTNTLFDFGAKFLDKVNPALEMGRAFVVKKYRKSYNPLLLLWKGIGRYVGQNRRYKLLFGPVSISNDYNPYSKLMMMRFLKAHHAPEDKLVKAIKPKNPPSMRGERTGGMRFKTINTVCPDIEDVASAISDIEVDGKGIPVLLKQYLKLGGTVLTFNLDQEFGDAIDGLMMVDLTKTPERTLERYMGKDEAKMFLGYHKNK